MDESFNTATSIARSEFSARQQAKKTATLWTIGFWAAAGAYAYAQRDTLDSDVSQVAFGLQAFLIWVHILLAIKKWPGCYPSIFYWVSWVAFHGHGYQGALANGFFLWLFGVIAFQLGQWLQVKK
jgi:hypothetical protein